MLKGMLVNDYISIGSPQQTLWTILLESIPGLEWVGDKPFTHLASYVEEKALTDGWPDYIIRNGTFFRHINLPVPQFAFYQDNCVNYALIKGMQFDVAAHVTMTVFNSPFLLSKYPEIAASCNHMIVPAPVDFEMFKPWPEPSNLRTKWGIPENAVCWIGANNQWKGFDLLTELVHAMPHINFVVVRKDQGDEFHDCANVTRLFNLPHAEVAEVINACRMGLCTSTMESQHLGGIEMGACGLPLVVPDVGAYYGRYPGAWGMTVPYRQQFRGRIEAVLARNVSRETVREYWLREPFSKEKVITNWKGIIQAITGRSLESA